MEIIQIDLLINPTHTCFLNYLPRQEIRNLFPQVSIMFDTKNIRCIVQCEMKWIDDSS